MSDISRLTRKLEQLPEEIEETGKESIENELGTVESRAKRNLRRDGTWWQGDIAHSMGVVPTNDGYRLITEAQHASYVEYGTGSYFGTSTYPIPASVDSYSSPDGVTEDMVANITEWVKTKPIIPRHYETQSELAQAISHTIAELGTQAHPYIRPAWYGYKNRLLKNVRNDIKRDVRRKY